MLHPRPLLSLVLSALSLCGFAKGKSSAQLTLFVGTYTEDSPSEGIYVFHFNQETGHFSLRSSVKAGNPSSPTFVSTKAGDRLGDPENRPGSDPCNLYTDGHCLTTANYSGGDISAFKLDKQADCTELPNRRDLADAIRQPFRTSIVDFPRPMASISWPPTWVTTAYTDLISHPTERKS